MNSPVLPDGPIRRPCWMVVDDDRDILLLLEAMLARLTNAQLEFYRSPQDALASFEAQPGGYDFVITDLQMPQLDGLELARRFRAISPKLKMLLVTGAAVGAFEDFASHGFCGLMQKPFTFAMLESALNSLGVIHTSNRSIVSEPNFLRQ